MLLKNEMERFGRVDIVFMGNRQQNEAPMVRFATSVSAETALQAINTGQVTFDGVTAKAEYKKGSHDPLQRPVGEREMDYTSRDLVREYRRR